MKTTKIICLTLALACGLAVGAFSAPPSITSIVVYGSTLNMIGANGPAGGTYTLLETTGLGLPRAEWTPVLTNTFDGNGNFTLSANVVDPANSVGFYTFDVQGNASTTYAANVAGYIKETVPAGQYDEFANQLVNGSDVNRTNNAVDAVLAGEGLVSDPAGGSNTELLVFNGTEYLPYYYLNASDAGPWEFSPAGWYDIVGNSSPAVMAQGSSSFVLNQFQAPITFTIAGTVIQGTNNLETVPTGWSLLSLGVPVSTNIDAPGVGLPDSLLSSDPNGPPNGHNDEYLFYNGTEWIPYYYFNYSDGQNWGVNGSTAGFYDQTGNPVPPSSYPAIGHGFAFYHYGAPFTYANVFEVR